MTSTGGGRSRADVLAGSVWGSGSLESATGSMTAVAGILSFESVLLAVVVRCGYIDTVTGNATGLNTHNASRASGTIVTTELSLIIGVISTRSDSLATVVPVTASALTTTTVTWALWSLGVSSSVGHVVHSRHSAEHLCGVVVTVGAGGRGGLSVIGFVD